MAQSLKGPGYAVVRALLDRFEITLYPTHVEHVRFRRAHVAINGVPLIELVRSAEEPWARAEYLERLPEAENPDEFKFEPGDYHYLSAAQLLLPSRELLDGPCDPGFVLDPDVLV